MRIAAVQCLIVPDDLDHACDALACRLEWTDREAIDLVLFPEAFILGHSYDPQMIERRAQRNSTTESGKVASEKRGQSNSSCTPDRLLDNVGGCDWRDWRLVELRLHNGR